MCCQRFLLRSAEEATQRLADRLSSSCLHAYLESFETECQQLIRVLWNYSFRLWLAHQKARVDPKEAVKSHSILALCLHALESVLKLAGRYSESFLAQRLDKLLTGGQPSTVTYYIVVGTRVHITDARCLCGSMSDLRRRLEELKSQHGNWRLLPFHAHVHAIQEQTTAHVKAERHHEATACLSLLSFFASYLATDDSLHAAEARKQSGDWAVQLLQMPEAGQPTIIRRLLAYLPQFNPSRDLWTELIKDLLTCNGGLSGKRNDRELAFPSVNAKTTTAFATAVCAALNHDMDQCDWLLAQTKVINTYAPPNRGAATQDEQKDPLNNRPGLLLLARQQYNEQCWQRLHDIGSSVHHIARVTFVKSELEKIGHTLIRTLKLVTLAIKQVYAAARSPSPTFNALVEFTVATLCPTTDKWQEYVTIGLQRLREEESAAELKKEARLLPELQKAFSTCEAAIMRLSRADFCRSDYTRHMQRFKARDFQLTASNNNQHSDTDSQHSEDDEESDDDSESEEEERERRRRRKQRQRSGRVKQSQRLHKSQPSQRKKRNRHTSSSSSSDEQSDSEKENRPSKRTRPLKSESESD